MSNLVSWLGFLTPLFALTAMPVLGDSWPPPGPRVFTSERGSYGFNVDPKGFITSTGLLFGVEADGKPRTVWTSKLVNVPHRVYVSDDGKHVVTIDTYGLLGYAHALVVYGDNGIVLADYIPEELFTSLETQMLPRTTSSRHWAQHATFAFSQDGKHFVITFKRAKLLRDDLENMKEAVTRAIKDSAERDRLRQRIEQAQSALQELRDRVITVDLHSGKLEGVLRVCWTAA